MALIKCPQCNKDISDTIDKCIHCGYLFEWNWLSALLTEQ